MNDPSTFLPLSQRNFGEKFRQTCENSVYKRMLNDHADMAEIPNEVDILVVGGMIKSRFEIDLGGASGCVVAGRLARRFPNLQILIIEAGRNNRDDPLVQTPAFYIHHLKPESQTASFYISKPSPHVAGRSNTVASGGLLGGGSSINFMMYTRASASDYDDWKTEGWTFQDLQPLLLQVLDTCESIKCP